MRAAAAADVLQLLRLQQLLLLLLLLQLLLVRFICHHLGQVAARAGCLGFQSAGRGDAAAVAQIRPLQ